MTSEDTASYASSPSCTALPFFGEMAHSCVMLHDSVICDVTHMCMCVCVNIYTCVYIYNIYAHQGFAASIVGIIVYAVCVNMYTSIYLYIFMYIYIYDIYTGQGFTASMAGIIVYRAVFCKYIYIYRYIYMYICIHNIYTRHGFAASIVGIIVYRAVCVNMYTFIDIYLCIYIFMIYTQARVLRRRWRVS